MIAIVLDIPFVLNPGTWPSLFALLPYVIFIGAAFFSVLYRYYRAAWSLDWSPDGKYLAVGDGIYETALIGGKVIIYQMAG